MVDRLIRLTSQLPAVMERLKTLSHFNNCKCQGSNFNKEIWKSRVREIFSYLIKRKRMQTESHTFCR